MFLYYGLYVVCAAITNFYVVFVENLAVPVVFRKVFADEVQKLSAYVCFYVHTVRWIKQFFVCSCGYSVLCGLLVSCVR